MTIEINTRRLRGKSALSLLADWMELISAELKKGNDPSIQINVKDDEGVECVFEFRANSIPGEFQRVELKASRDASDICFACGAQHHHLIGFPPQCPSCYGDNG